LFFIVERIIQNIGQKAAHALGPKVVRRVLVAGEAKKRKGLSPVSASPVRGVVESY
jgi:hypothetical protein